MLTHVSGLIIAGGEDGRAAVHDLTTGQRVGSFQAASDTLNGFMFHPGLPLAATASGQAPLLAWSAPLVSVGHRLVHLLALCARSYFCCSFAKVSRPETSVLDCVRSPGRLDYLTAVVPDLSDIATSFQASTDQGLS